MNSVGVSQLVSELASEYERSRAFLSALEQSLHESRAHDERQETDAEGSAAPETDAQAPGATCNAQQGATPPKKSSSLKGKLARFFSRKESKSSSSSKVVVVDPTAENDTNVSSVQGLRRASVVEVGEKLLRSDSIGVGTGAQSPVTSRLNSFVTRSGNSLAAMPPPQSSSMSPRTAIRRATSFRVAPISSSASQLVGQFAPEAVPPYPAAAAFVAASASQLSLPAMDLRRNGSRAASGGVLSTGGGGRGGGGALLFKKLQQLHVPLTSEYGDEGSKLNSSGGCGGVAAAGSAVGAPATAAACALLPELQIPGSPVSVSSGFALFGSGGAGAAAALTTSQQRAQSLQQQQQPSSFRRRSATAVDAAGFLLPATTGFISAAGPLMTQPQALSQPPKMLSPTASTTDDGTDTSALCTGWCNPSPRRAGTLVAHHKPPSSLRSQSFRHIASHSRAAGSGVSLESADYPSGITAAAAASFMSGACAGSRIHAYADLAQGADDGGDGGGDAALAGGFDGVLPEPIAGIATPSVPPQVSARRAPSSTTTALGPASGAMAALLLRRGDGGHGVGGAVAAAGSSGCGSGGGVSPRGPAAGSGNALTPTPLPAGPLMAPQPPPPAAAGAMFDGGQHRRKPHRAASTTCVLAGSSSWLQALSGGGETFRK